ncbi:hypothetical protein EB001_05460 [bacterium]|nr:hypothetical protein [bacterium]
MSSQSINQSFNEHTKVTEISNEIHTKVTDSNFQIVDISTPNDRSYEMRHWRASKIRWQEDGSVILQARNSTAAPNLGFLDINSTGYTQISAEHNVIISAKGHKKTGGGKGGSDDEKSIEMGAVGDIVIKSNGKGGVYITSAKNLEFRCAGDMIFTSGGQISMNTGSKDPIPGELTKGVGSNKFTISTGVYELSTVTYKETVTGAKNTINHGEINQQQKIALTEPTLPSQHITTTETVGSLVHKVGYDYVLEVDGKMLLKVNNNPAKKVLGVLGGPGVAMGYPVQLDALQQKIIGNRSTFILPSPLNKGEGNDATTITLGSSSTTILAAGTKGTAFSVSSQTKGDIAMSTLVKGNIALAAGPSPTNNIIVSNAGGSVRINASGAKGMIQMIATTQIVGTAIKINLN